MVKRIFSYLVLMVFLCSLTTSAAVVGRGSGGAAKTYILGPVGFESGEGYTNGLEVDNQGDWTEDPGTTDIFMVSNAQAHSGSQSMFVTVTGNNDILRTFASQTSVFTLVFWYRSNDATDQSGYFDLCAGACTTSSNRTFTATVAGSNSRDWEYHNGVAVTNLTNADVVADDTWYMVEVEVTPSASTCTFDFWMGDGSTQTQYGDDLNCRNDLTNITNFAIGDNAVGTGDFYIDDVEIYEGARQAP